MFSYYGSKSRVINCYPAPKHDLIIEPFAGSARYSLKYYYKDVILIEKNQYIVDIWHYLQQATKADILALPKIKVGDDIRSIKGLSDGEKKLLSYIIGEGLASPINKRNAYSKMHRQINNLLQCIDKINHWDIRQGEYTDLDNQKATWFIDPPYINGGHKYKHSNKHIDYAFLADWCKERQGQVIVCENSYGDWLDFHPISQMTGNARRTTEVMWCNDVKQYRLF